MSLVSLARPLSLLPTLFRRASRGGRVIRGNMLGHGLSRRDGAVVGAWFGSCPGMRKGLVVKRLPCGRRLTYSAAPDDMWGVLRRVIALRDDVPATESHLSAGLEASGVAREVAEGLARIAAAGMRETASAFLGTLDPAMLAVAARGLTIAAAPEAMDRTLGGDPALSALALAYPTLFSTLRRRLDDCVQDLPTDPARVDEWDAVARSTVRELTGAPAWAVAHVPALNAMLVASVPAGRDVDGDMVREIDTLLSLPPSWAPSTPGGWEAYGRVSAGIRKARSLPTHAADLHLLLGSKGRWDAWAASLMPHVPAGGTLEGAVGDVADVQRAFRRQVLGPAVRMHGVNVAYHHEVARDVMWSGLSLRSILALSARWHLARAAIEARVAAVGRPGAAPPRREWGAGLPNHVEGGFAIVVLTTPTELSAEGYAMSHCVGDYAHACRSGRARIVSIRRVLPAGGFDRVSTAEIDVSRKTFSVAQHKGTGNSVPPADADAALARYVGLLADGRLAVDADGLAIVPEPIGEGEAGYDWRVEGAWEQVLDAWRPCLPTRIGRLGHAAMADLARRAEGDLCGWWPRHLLDGR